MRTSRSRNVVLPLCLAFAAAAWMAGCTSPDPEGVMDNFRDFALGDHAGNGGGGEEECTRPQIQPEGSWFCALSANLDRESPLYMELNFSLSGDTLTVDAQPLIRDLDEDGETAMEGARNPIGDPLPQVEATYGEDSHFEIRWEGVTVIDEANPITFRAITGTLVLQGQFYSDEVAAGVMGGEITHPLPVPLGGSTFACQKTDNPASIDPVYYDLAILEIADRPDCL